MQASKQIVWVIWIGSLAAVLFGSGWVVTAGQFAFGATFLAHVAEYFMKRALFERVGGSAGHHFVQTLIYGLFHWKPLEDAEGDAGDR